MNIYKIWMDMPFKARMYIGASTFAFAFICDYALTRVEEEVQERKAITGSTEEGA